VVVGLVKGGKVENSGGLRYLGSTRRQMPERELGSNVNSTETLFGRGKGKHAKIQRLEKKEMDRGKELKTQEERILKCGG